jgi:hypothetical protein
LRDYNNYEIREKCRDTHLEFISSESDKLLDEIRKELNIKD